MKTLLDNPEIISLFIKSNKERYEYQEYQNITERLNDYFKKDEVVSNLDGYTDFDSDRTKCLIEELSKNGILKTKLLKMGLKVGALVFAGVATVMNNKMADDEMKATVEKKVAEALANQAKES